MAFGIRPLPAASATGWTHAASAVDALVPARSWPEEVTIPLVQALRGDMRATLVAAVSANVLAALQVSAAPSRALVPVRFAAALDPPLVRPWPFGPRPGGDMLFEFDPVVGPHATVHGEPWDTEDGASADGGEAAATGDATADNHAWGSLADDFVDGPVAATGQSAATASDDGAGAVADRDDSETDRHHPRVFQCRVPNCGKRFSHRQGLARHVLAHMGERRYACVVCRRSFGRLDNCQKHERTHRHADREAAIEEQRRQTSSETDAAGAANAVDADAAADDAADAADAADTADATDGTDLGGPSSDF